MASSGEVADYTFPYKHEGVPTLAKKLAGNVKDHTEPLKPLV